MVNSGRTAIRPEAGVLKGNKGLSVHRPLSAHPRHGCAGPARSFLPRHCGRSQPLRGPAGYAQETSPSVVMMAEVG
jgi:hypothetical protein